MRMINIGFGTLMVAVGATPVSLLPPILVAMGYSTYVAIALPAIGYDALCTYALLGARILDAANDDAADGRQARRGSVRDGKQPVRGGVRDGRRVQCGRQ